MTEKSKFLAEEHTLLHGYKIRQIFFNKLRKN